MKTEQQLHAIRIKAPFYQNDQYCGLHRYLDADFVSRFRQDIQLRRFGSPQFNSWLEEERHSRHGREPVLRLPLHRAFHIVSCEAVCDCLGEPALDPQKITSAGFVIRRLNNGSEQAWMLEDGEALGWQEAPEELRDPDLHKRLRASGVLQEQNGQAPYSGEETHPLHVLTAKDAANKSHTVLFGYLPLGGFYYQRDAGNAFDGADQQQVMNVAAEALPWPFGYRKPFSQTWREEHGKPIVRGRPVQAMFELLRMLVNRYHLGESGIAENAALERLAQQLWFCDETEMSSNMHRQGYTESSQALFAPYYRMDLLSYLQACFARGGENPLVRWIIDQEKSIDAAGANANPDQLDHLPKADGQGTLNMTLLLLASQAEALRELLGQRLRDQTLLKVKEIPLPKFNQNPGDTYQILIFIRTRNKCGQEQVVWSDTARSIPFRVAAPFDPEASRPALIQMPSLSDLRRGLAKGVAMITPADTFNLMNSLKLNKGVSPDVLPADNPDSGSGIQWICSFSLPVITMVAMILLMIMISLLNLLFFWVPWVRICLPFPKMKK